MSHDGCVALPPVSWVCLQFVIMVFPNHTHLLFLVSNYIDKVFVFSWVLIVSCYLNICFRFVMKLHAVIFYKNQANV